MQKFDILIKNGRVVDGTSNPGYLSDIGISGDKIKYIGRVKEAEAKEIIDARGLIVAPGFIDMHGHSDGGIYEDSSIFNMIEQGITTEISGMCGFSVAPVSETYFEQLRRYAGVGESDSNLIEKWKKMSSFKHYLDSLEDLPLGPNVAFYVGHGTIRIAVMGFEDRKPTADELNKMKDLVEDAMESGALGLTTGLIYPPGVYADKKEIIELCKVVAKYGGSYASHIRNESHSVVEAVKEAIDIGRHSGVPVIISHHKIAGKANWGLSTETLALIEDANREGIDVALDQYPYKAGSTGLKATIPPKYHIGGTEALLKRLKDPATRLQIKKDIMQDDRTWENLAYSCGLDNIMVFCDIPDVNGKTVADYASLTEKEGLDALIDLLIETKADAGAVYFMMDEIDIERIMQNPYTMIGTDGGVVDKKSGNHPRAVGTFPKVLGQYVRERKVLRLEDAIRKMTSLPAQKAGLKAKGLIKEGFDADLVIFNPETIIDRATYQEPTLKNEGLNYVIVNGKVAVKDNKYIGVGSGKVIRL